MKSLKIVFAVALVATTAACSSSKSASSSATAVERLPIEWQYLNDVRTEGAEMTNGFSDDALLTLGKAACKSLNGGTSLNDVVTEQVKSATEQAGVTDAQATEFVASYMTKAIINFCPEYQPN